MVDMKGADYWIGLVAYGKKSLEEIFNKIWPEARNYSIQLASTSINFNL